MDLERHASRSAVSAFDGVVRVPLLVETAQTQENKSLDQNIPNEAVRFRMLIVEDNRDSASTLAALADCLRVSVLL
jgi:hypothetical protein